MDLITPPPQSLVHPSCDGAEQEARASQAFGHEHLRLQAGLREQEARQDALIERLRRAYSDAERQHAEIEAALRALAEALAPLTGAAAPQLSTLGLSEAYLQGGTRLQQALRHRLERALGGSEASTSGDHRQLEPAAQQAELQSLRLGLELGARSELAAEIAVARAAAELGYLQRAAAAAAEEGAPTPSPDPAALRREAEAAESRLAAALGDAEALASEVAAQQCLPVLEAQYGSRLQAAQARCQASQEVAAAMTAQLARQLLLERTRRQESAALREMHATAAAAAGDASAVLEATKLRVAEAAAAAAAEQPSSLGGAAQGQEVPGEASPAAAEPAICAAAVDQLLHLREDVGRLSGEFSSSLLPAYRAAFARLHALTYDGPDLARPALTDPHLAAQLEEAGGAAEALQRQAAAVLAEVAERQRGQARRALPEAVLVDFFRAPDRLAAAAKRNAAALGLSKV